MRMGLATQLIVAAVLTGGALLAQGVQDTGWPTYGGDAGGRHYSAANQITRQNISHLHPVWTYHTEAVASHRPGSKSAAFETTPVLFRNTLYLTTPFSDVRAIDPATGKEKWSYEATANVAFFEGSLVTNRGVATWEDSTVGTGPCRARVFVGTLAGALHAVDADTGKRCRDFGKDGIVNMTAGLNRGILGFGMTSAPTVIGAVVVTGSTMSDNYSVSMPKGSVRGYDVRSGRMLWSWDPIPWGDSQNVPTGAANAWSTISADPALGLIFVPTGSASPDYYGGMRTGDGRDADSVVAIDAKTGKKVWAFQVVHHNLWDYDVASEPVLFTLHGKIPAVAITTKMGMVFVLDRRTGVPLYPVEERPVPQTDVAGETTSPTQPFSSLPTLSPIVMVKNETGWTRSAKNTKRCQELVSGLRYEGMFTPPSEQGTMMFPGSIGGVNWGGPALDGTTNILYANTNRAAYSVRLLKREKEFGGQQEIVFRKLLSIMPRLKKLAIFSVAIFFLALVLRFWKTSAFLGIVAIAFCALVVIVHQHGLKLITQSIDGAFGHDHSPMFETPFELLREPIKDYDGVPCVAPPWGGLTAINLETGQKEWEKPLGSMYPGFETGTTNLGGPMVSAGGLVFTAATRDGAFRAFDARSGELLWKYDLPVPAQTTPMSYLYGGKQYVVIAAGGHGLFGTKIGDSVIAFAVD